MDEYIMVNQDKIKLFIEDRKAAATVAKLTSKMKHIVKYLGEELVGLGFGTTGDISIESYDRGIQYEEIESEDGIPTMDGSEGSHVISYFFDGLSRGMNLQIYYDPNDESVKATYHGILVYLELQGTIQTYVPHSSWESHVNSLFQVAEKTAKIKEAQIAEEKKEEAKSQMHKVWDYLRTNWGFRR